MRLNGWQRIGIILTLIWFVGEDSGFEICYWTTCVGLPFLNLSDALMLLIATGGLCNKKFNADWKRDVTDHLQEWNAYNLAYTVIPIPIVWLLVYGFVAILRWVKAGFAVGKP